jgi:arylformamidase
MTWTDYRDNLEWQFNPGVTTPHGRDPAEAVRNELAEQAHAALDPQTGLRYGPGARQLLDFFPAQGPARAIHVYLHGGYWRRGDRRISAFAAAPSVRRGVAYAAVGYDLCPDVSLEAVVAEAIDAVEWLHRNAARLGVPGGRIYITGHSAGAHLAAMVLACDWAGRGLDPGFIAGANLLSGIYEVEPVVHISVNEQARLTVERARALSPMLHPPRVAVPVVLAAGALESPGWIDQTTTFAEVCRAAGCKVEVLTLPQADHYSVPVAAIGRDDAAILRSMLRVLGA